MLVKDFFHKYELKNKAMSNIKRFQVLSYLGLSDVGIFLRDGTFSSGIGIVNLHPIYIQFTFKWVQMIP